MENLKEEILSQESADKSRKLQKETVKREAKIFNKDFNWENYERALDEGQFSMIALLELFKSGVLRPEDLTRADAERINALKDKENITDEEKKELQLRERGDLFYDKRHDKYPAVNFGGMMILHEEGRIYKEVHFISESVKGFLGGEKVDLERIEYDIEPASLEELREHDPEQAKGFEQIVYRGKIGESELGEEEARKLLEKYIPFAKKRSDEVDNLIRSAKR